MTDSPAGDLKALLSELFLKELLHIIHHCTWKIVFINLFKYLENRSSFWMQETLKAIIKVKQCLQKSCHADVSISAVSEAHACIMWARIRPWCETFGGSVSRFKLQKHESSSKHALFTALIGCGIAQSSVCAACFPKMLEKPAEISLTCHKVTQTIFTLLLWLQLSPPCARDCFLQ